MVLVLVLVEHCIVQCEFRKVFRIVQGSISKGKSWEQCSQLES